MGRRAQKNLHWTRGGSLVPGDASEEELRAFDAGRYGYYGEELAVRWADVEESQHLIRTHFKR